MEVTNVQVNNNSAANTIAGKPNATVTAPEKETEKKDKQKSTEIINASELNLVGNQDTKLKELFGKKAALKVQLDQFAQDSKVDDKIQEHADTRDKLLEEASTNMNEVTRINGLKQDLKETYGVTDDSQEQKDLELLEKRAKRVEPLTKDEMDRVANMGPLTDYQIEALNYDSMASVFQSRAKDAADKSINETMSIDSIKLGLLKEHPMVDASKEAQNLLDQVDGEIQQAIVNKLKEKVNENLDIDPNDQILTDPTKLIDKKKVTEDDLKGLAVDQKV